eukprot:TRINITY_DN12796_c0_g1_i1.p1 TRINITY_DN12796_c0_g1~~TRINITY_DN12796_c0_g1_i1.p1  ORF type:complete len:237 (+),score=35.49 TRINITY_DN12796_c0_g1_i1:59-769(+)
MEVIKRNENLNGRSAPKRALIISDDDDDLMPWSSSIMQKPLQHFAIPTPKEKLFQRIEVPPIKEEKLEPIHVSQHKRHLSTPAKNSSSVPPANKLRLPLFEKIPNHTIVNIRKDLTRVETERNLRLEDFRRQQQPSTVRSVAKLTLRKFRSKHIEFKPTITKIIFSPRNSALWNKDAANPTSHSTTKMEWARVLRSPTNELTPTPDPKLTLRGCLLYTSDAADDLLCVDLGGRRII